MKVGTKKLDVRGLRNGEHRMSLLSLVLTSYYHLLDRPGQTRRPSPRTSIGECAKRKANWDCRVVSGNRRPLCNWKWKLEAWNCDTERVSMRFLTNRPYLIELNWIGYLNSSTVLLCFGLRERKLTEAIVHVCFFAFKKRMHHATQENADRGLNRLSNISKDGRVANLTSAPGGQRSRYTTVLRIRGTFCDDALYKLTFTFTLWQSEVTVLIVHIFKISKTIWPTSLGHHVKHQ